MGVITRAAARSAGSITYFTGKECLRGHISERLVSNGNCRACMTAYLKDYFADPEKQVQKSRAYVASRKRSPEMRARDVARYTDRYRTDPLFAMQSRLRARVNAAFRAMRAGKVVSTQAMLGADWATVKDHIESQFLPGMTWQNRDQWHIDHKTPLKRAKDQHELAHLCCYSNLQPLWASDNLRKGSK